MRIGKVVSGILLILIGFSSSIIAQSNYISGYIIKKDNDTTFGEIDYQEWVQTPDSIFFRGKNADEKLVLKAIDIVGFYVSDEIYSSELVTIDMTPQKAKLEASPSQTFQESVKKKVFLQSLVKGDALDLYLYKKKRENFYIKESSSFVELISHEYIVNDNGGYFVVSKNVRKFQKQLKNLSNGCGSLVEKDAVYYSIKSLVGFTIKCNEYLKGARTYIYEPPKPIVNHGIIVGTGINNFSVTINGEKIDYNSTSYFSIGYSVDITLPRGRKKRKVSAELLFSSFKARSRDSYNTTFYGGSCSESGFSCQILINQSFEESTTDINFLKLNIVYTNKFLARDFSPTFLAGGGIGGGVYSTTEAQIETKVYHEENGSRTLKSFATEKSEVYEPVDFTLNLFGGIGVTYKKYSLSFLYEPRLMKNNIVPYQSFYANLKFSFL